MRPLRFVMAGLLVVGLVVMAEAQPRFFGAGGGPGFLLQQAAVQKELKLTDEQVTKVEAWGEELRAKQIETFKEVQGLPKEQRLAKLAARTTEARKAAYKELADVLKPEQLTRLQQIERQIGGAQTFQDPDTLTALKVTDEQKAKINTALDDLLKGRQELMSSFPKDKFDQDTLSDMVKKQSELGKKALDNITATLTDEQKKTWKGLTGEPFDQSKLQPFGNFGKAKAKD